MKNTYLSMLLAGALSLASCDNFLDQAPRHQHTLETAVTDYESAKNIVNGIYSKLSSSTLSGTHFMKLSAQSGVYMHFEANYTENLKAEDSGLSGTWSSLYGVINAANAAVLGLDALDGSFYPSEKEKNRLLAEAKCIRGFINTNLFWSWGHFWAEGSDPYGLLYRDKLADLSNLQVKRLNVEESYAKILEDLDYAIAYLGDFTSSRYVSKQFAQAVKAKLLLNRGWDGDYAVALDLVQQIKAEAPSKFHIEGDLEKLYNESWDSPEVLFARYLPEKGGYSARTYSEFGYSYDCIYNAKMRYIPQDWFDNDPRYMVLMDSVRAPETWDTSKKWAIEKLCHRGRVDGPNDPYATYYFKYNELYLLEAELKYHLNPSDIAGALAPLNELRAQITNPVLEPLAVTSADEFEEVLFKEILMFSFLENGNEWFASLRLKKDGRTWLEVLKSDVNVITNRRSWPIPDAEMKTNQLMEQNPY